MRGKALYTYTFTLLKSNICLILSLISLQIKDLLIVSVEEPNDLNDLLPPSLKANA